MLSLEILLRLFNLLGQSRNFFAVCLVNLSRQKLFFRVLRRSYYDVTQT